MSINRMIFTFTFLLLFISCSQNGENKNSHTDSPYQFDNPATVIKLPKELKEISGISLVDNTTLACITDELGIIYHYDTQKKEITERIEFSKSGDFEDIVYLEGGYFILKSNGTLVHYKDEKLEEYSTPLSKANNTEGLCYDKQNNRLIISCKENPRLLFSFDLKEMKLNKNPLVQITEKGFNPTALVVNSTDEIYAMAGNGQFGIFHLKDSTGTSISLPKNLFPQPEGMALSDNGDLWISNEGKEGKASLLLFKNHE